ncbi:hypothetical protein P5Y53_14530 [Dyella jiangningensis]|uniref:hypothetical protein n=1 Tax=Dyella jiangningensis TaxID=1379159 RepID=UPI00240F7BFF|nr:hypothetical protein [Dyella jiangningensis]MDG2538889.1 hypothetical protein [Dyella jiangningensis]
MNRYLVPAVLLGACTLAGCHNRNSDGTEPGTHPAPSATASTPYAPTNTPPSGATTLPAPSSTSAQPASGSTTR